VIFECKSWSFENCLPHDYKIRVEIFNLHNTRSSHTYYAPSILNRIAIDGFIPIVIPYDNSNAVYCRLLSDNAGKFFYRNFTIFFISNGKRSTDNKVIIKVSYLL